MALLPKLDRARLMRFVNQHKLRENLVSWLKDLSRTRKHPVWVLPLLASMGCPLVTAACGPLMPHFPDGPAHSLSASGCDRRCESQEAALVVWETCDASMHDTQIWLARLDLW
jgi:hypothetical protein